MRVVAAVLLLVSVLHAGLWGVLRDKEPAPDFKGLLPSLSYTPFEPGHIVDNNVDPDKIRADMKKLSTLTRAIRSYSATEGNELVPPIAAEFGLKVTVGAWIGKDPERNERRGGQRQRQVREGLDQQPDAHDVAQGEAPLERSV